MPTITATTSGNWSVAGTWTGGIVPGNGDTADLNGNDVIMDIATIPASGILLAITSAGSIGTLVIGGAAGANVINATTMTAGTKGTAGTFQYSGSTCDSLTINGSIAGCASGGTDPYGVVKSATKALTINGNITGGGVTNSHGFYTAQNSGIITIVGNITGGSATTANGVRINSGATVNITGNSTGGSGANATGLYAASGSTITLTGNLIGGTGNYAMGAYNGGGGGITLNSCNMTNGTGGVAFGGKTPVWNITTDTSLTHGTYVFKTARSGLYRRR